MKFIRRIINSTMIGLVLVNITMKPMVQPEPSFLKAVFQQKYELFDKSKNVEKVISYLSMDQSQRKIMNESLRMREILAVGSRLIFQSATYSTNEKDKFIGAMKGSWKTYGKQMLLKLSRESIEKAVGTERVSAYMDLAVDEIWLLLSYIGKLIGFAKSARISQFTMNTPINLQGETPLHIAALSGSVSAIETMVGFGVNVNAKDRKGNTPVHVAAQNNQIDALLKLLLPHFQFDIRDGLDIQLILSHLYDCNSIENRLVQR